MPRVFLCHSSADKDKRIVGRIADDLSIRAEGVTLLNEASVRSIQVKDFRCLMTYQVSNRPED
jgi:hypothetical protein